MKKVILAGLAVVMAFSMYAKDLKELVVTTTPPMSCQNCENRIKGNLRFEKGVKKIETNLSEQRVTIEYDADKTNPEKIENAFEKIGYQVEVINPNQDNCTSPSSCCQNSGSAPVEGCQGGCCQNNQPQ